MFPFMKRLNNHIAAPSWIPIVSHANLKAHREPMTEIESSASSMWDRICGCSMFANFAIYFATFQAYFSHLSSGTCDSLVHAHNVY